VFVALYGSAAQQQGQDGEQQGEDCSLQSSIQEVEGIREGLD
jgi:hypothetical protein